MQPQSDSSAALEQPFPPAMEGPTVARSVRQLLSKWWVAFAASSLFVVSGHLLIKGGLNAAAAHVANAVGLARIFHTILQPEVVAGLTIYLLGSACWIVAVAQQEISFLYPLSSLNYVLVVVASVTFFHEAISLRRSLGLSLIVLGMVLMNRRKASKA